MRIHLILLAGIAAARSMSIPLGTKLPRDCVSQLSIAGQRAAIFFFDASAGEEDVAMLTGVEGANLESYTCVAIAVPQGGGSEAVGGRFSSLKLLGLDDAFAVDGESTTLAREFAVQPYTTFQGPVPGRESYVVDAAGIVRGVHVEQKDGASHAAAALQSLAALEANSDAVAAEAEFKAQATVTADGKVTAPVKLSAVGRMREKQANEAAARGADGDDKLVDFLNNAFNRFLG